MRIISLLFIFSLSITVHSQDDCTDQMPFNEGTTWEITSYNKKGKKENVTSQKVTSVEDTDDGRNINVEQEITDKKGKEVSSSSYEMSCVDGVVQVSIESIMTAENNEMFAGQEVTVEADDMMYPADMKAGDELNDAELDVSVKMAAGAPSFLNLHIKVFNRKVVTKEEITTSAGTFMCYKITYDVEMKTVVKVKASTTEWYAPGVGMIRQENYNKKGKLTGYSELTAFSL